MREMFFEANLLQRWHAALTLHPTQIGDGGHVSSSLAARWRNDTVHAEVYDQLTVMVGDVP